MKPITKDTALKIWETLVEHVDVYNSKREREDFVHHQVKGCREYRIQGKLGFGGKFRNNGSHPYWYVDFYPEDRTAERERIVKTVNEKLRALYEITPVDNPVGS